MKVWFDGEGDIACDLEQIQQALANPGEYFVAVVSLMPGLTEVELVEQGDGFVTIRTNEGLMQRTNLSISVDAERVVLEFDELYDASGRVTATSHYRDEFLAADTGVRNHLAISGVEAPGVLGFLYRNFGSKSIGKAVLEANRRYLAGESRDS